MHKRLLFAGMAALAALGAGCASQPSPPTDHIVQAQEAINRAERAGAARYAGAELALAREKVARAQSRDVIRSGDAVRQAEQAKTDAELAEARAQADKADAAVAEVEKSLNALREEAERTTPR